MTRYLTGTILLFGLILRLSISDAAPKNIQSTVGEADRHALVMGVSASYANENNPLRTPVNNAIDVAWALHNAGFSVTLFTDGSPAEIQSSIRRMLQQLSKDPNSIGVIYFSGLWFPDPYDDHIINLAKDLPKTNRLNVVIADGNFRFPGSYCKPTVTKEMVDKPLAENTIFISATQPGKMHSEGTKRNSPFTTQLLKVLQTSDLSLKEIIQTVTDQVSKSTKNQQRSWHSSIRNTQLADEILIPKEVREWANQMSPAANQPRPQAFKDCADCPEMVMVPPGRFMMGSPNTEPGQTGDSPGYRREGPQHSVTIPQTFAVGKYEITRAEFVHFIQESGKVVPPLSDLWIYTLNNLPNLSGKISGYKRPNEPPAFYVNLPYAEMYAEWLSKKTGKKYRLPNEAEWEYAARAGTQSARFWGKKSEYACRYANVADRSHDNDRPGRYPRHKCKDGYASISPVGCFEPNQFGLYDMIGNVWEWTTTRWTFTGLFAIDEENKKRTMEEGKELYILKGGSCNSRPRFTRSAYRIWAERDTKDSTYGFRVVRDQP